MRILALSLLRIGDTLMHLKILEGLRAQYPEAKIEIAINDDFVHTIPFLQRHCSSVHLFPRRKLQNLINSRENHLAEPLWCLSDWIESLQASNIHTLFNFTHTRLSGFLMGLIPAPQKKGLVMNGEQSQLCGNEWLQYYNENFSSASESQFHSIDVLARAFDIEVTKETFVQRKSKKISLQMFTSDPKKNWSLDHWKVLYAELQNQYPDYKLSVLATPKEKPWLLAHFSESDIHVLDFEEVAQTLSDSELLISGDTSLVHLAALTQTRALVIALGSSDPIKTSPYLEGSLVISGRSECFPCHHAKPCSQLRHLCGDSVSPRQVLTLVQSILSPPMRTQLRITGGTEAYGKKDRKPSRSQSSETGIGL
jgi:ADP-heptose:LPS heptosyltransferase